jgi:hypothetical protein
MAIKLRSQLNEAIRFTRKKYVSAIAHAIKSSSLPDDHKAEVANRIATVFQMDRPSFDVDEFVQSCCADKAKDKNDDPWHFTAEQ